MLNLIRSFVLALCLMWAPTARTADDVAAVVASTGHAEWTEGNRIELIVDPQQAWQARLDLISRAKHHIFVSAFSWHNDPFGVEFAERLAEVVADRRRENPDFIAYCMIDSSAMGLFNRYSRTFKELRNAGAVIIGFNPSLATATAVYDGRLHDKMIIVDGRWALVSGRNVAEEYYDPLEWWFDAGVSVEGPAVQVLQMNFLKAWASAIDLAKTGRFFWPEEKIRQRIRTLWRTGRFPGGDSPLERYMTSEFFPPSDGSGGGVKALVLYDNPFVSRRAASTDVLIELVARAEHELDLMTPFPNMPDELVSEIELAAARGVAVRLFVNGPEAAIRGGPFLLSGLPTVIRLIDVGAEVWAWSGDGEFHSELEETGCSPPTMPPMAVHGKVARIDDELTMVHSSNFNIRSTYYNTEAGLVMMDRRLNQELKALLDRLISLHDLEIACEDGLAGITVEHVVHRLTVDDIPDLERKLGKKQGFLDSMAVVW
jgi:phosphatidylserine/phosphatidylglycerophosphate/cardiolipin synthase-like enzyme